MEQIAGVVAATVTFFGTLAAGMWWLQRAERRMDAQEPQR